ncbi:MarR family transcriptional regulator [Actinospica robiniae]|uniref:MarR family transcriptional regulator n=1 Tax=Actinospica robiniae TaxID=304901 RepID=UPI00042731B9|nr:helix-turn-helix domain-containing protein [Actinospica robiniae]
MPASPSVTMTPSMTALLDALSAQNGASVTELAKRASLGRSTTARVLAVLEKKGLARRERTERVPDLWFAAHVAASANDESVEPTSASHAAPDEGSDYAEPACESVPQNTDPSTQEGQRQPEEETEPDPSPAAPNEDGGERVPQEAEGPGSPTPEVGGEQPEQAVENDQGEQAPESADEPDVPVEDGGEPAVPEVPGAAASGTDAPRLAKGGLRALVVAHLCAHPAEDFTASKLGRVLGKSSGAISNALDTLVKLGQAEMTCEKPRAFRHLDDAGS